MRSAVVPVQAGCRPAAAEWCCALALAAAAGQGYAQTPAAAGFATQGETVTVAAGVPLHVVLTHTARMRVGAPVDGVLTAPVWVFDRLVFPKGAAVRGEVTMLEPLHGEDRQKALLNGDVTPLRLPVVRFRTIQVGSVEAPIESEARVRQTETVRFAPQAHTSLAGKAAALVKDRVHEAHEALFAPGKKDRAERLLFSQLPYHPQRIWLGTDMVADLQAPAAVTMPGQKAHVQDAALVTSLPPNVAVHARLVSALDSDTAKRGDAATAIVTEPVMDAQQNLLLPEGAELQGEVLRAKPSRSFGRNGTLRFTFRGVRRPGEPVRALRGTLTGAEGSDKQNLSVDAEGEVKAQPDKGRFAAPLLLAVTAAAGHDDDGGLGQQTVASNGLGLVARGVTLGVGSPNVAAGFGAYAFAKSIYFRFLRRGHAVTFPKDTLVDVQLSPR